jgi:outer membrane protein OmpA-like peptidoglycan-associated protein
VYDILAKNGVPSKSMSYAGLGPDDPQFNNGTPEGRFFNRTVLVVLTYPKM